MNAISSYEMVVPPTHLESDVTHYAIQLVVPAYRAILKTIQHSTRTCCTFVHRSPFHRADRVVEGGSSDDMRNVEVGHAQLAIIAPASQLVVTQRIGGKLTHLLIVNHTSAERI